MTKEIKKKPKEISHKRLVQIFKDIKRLNSEDIRFCFLIGAGASKSSDIPTGMELSKRWYNDLKDGDISDHEIEAWQKKTGVKFNFENAGHFYPYLYEKRYEASPEIGYTEFKRLMEDKEPSIGYVILSNILASEKHNFVITTNFDYLIEDAVRMYTSKKPFIAGHETLAEFISSQTERPTIIKVHRDLFLHPFNTNDSTCELDKEWKKALTPLLKNFNLLVLGYGGNDGSLMDYLKEIDPANRKAIYWCKRNKDVLNAKIENLLTEKDYIVPIEGFDELMYALYNALEYTTFNNLDKPDEHPFVLAAKNRILAIDEKRKKLIELAKDKKEDISEDVKNIMNGASRYIYEAYVEKNKDKKEIIYKEAIEKYPTDAYLLESYASFLFENNEVIKAEEFYQKAIKIKPDNHEAFNNWGTYLGDLAATKAGKESEELYNQSFTKFKKAVEINPDDQEAFFNWGNALGRLAAIKTGKESEELYNQSFTKFKKAVEINPDDQEAFFNWGTNLGNLAATKAGKESEELYNQSFTKFKKAIEIKPDYHEAFFNWGTNLGLLAATKTGKESEELYHQSFTKFQKAIEINPDDHEAFNNWGTYLGSLAATKAGKESEELYNQSLTKYQKAIEIKPDYHEAYNNWGNTLGRLAATKTGKESEELYHQSFTKYQKAIEIKPDYCEAFFNWGTNLGLLAATKTGKESEELYNQSFTKFKKAIEIKPDYHEAFNNWGITLGNLAVTKTGKESEELYNQASEKFQKAIKLGGRSYNLACMHSIKQEKEKALHYLGISLANKEIEAEFVMEDSDWDFHKEDPQFKELINKYLSERET